MLDLWGWGLGPGELPALASPQPEVEPNVITLHDLIHLPTLESWFGRIAQHPGGLVIIAGLESDGLSGILGILCRQMLGLPGKNRQPRRACAIGARPRFVRAPRSQEARLRYLRTVGPKAPTYAEALEQAAAEQADLIVLDELNAESLIPVLELAAGGATVLAPVSSLLVGGQVLGFLVDLGAPEALLGHIGWVVGVRRLQAACGQCGEVWAPSGAELEALGLKPEEVGAGPFFRNRGCSLCRTAKTRPLVTAFDVFRHDPKHGLLGEQLWRPSDLSLRDYALELARQGYIPLAEMRDLEAGPLRHAQAVLLRQQRELARTKVATLEASQRVLMSSYEALISLQDVAQTLASSTDEELARRILHYGSETLGADLAALYLIEPDGSGRMVAVAGWKVTRDSELVPAAEIARWLERAKQGQELAEGELPPGVGIPGDREGSRTGLLLVLAARGRPVGLLFAHSTTKRRFTIADKNLLQMFADQGAVSIQRRSLITELQAKIAALEQAQAELIKKERLEHELALAREIQESFLPIRFPDFPGLRLAARSMPARAVGGDFYDAFPLPEGRVGLVIADVSDKGMPAALFMALTRSLVRAEAQRESSPAQVLSSVNRLLLEMSSSAMFVTAFYGLLDPERGELVYARAGHERPIHYRAAERSCVPLPGEGIALGILRSAAPEQRSVILRPGDELVLFTDGVTDELLPGGEAFGHERLAQAIIAHADLDVEAQCEALFADLGAHQGSPEPFDDRAILLVRLEGPTGEGQDGATGNRKGET